jgi:zona occludens toxin (predicted ATPase)
VVAARAAFIPQSPGAVKARDCAGAGKVRAYVSGVFRNKEIVVLLVLLAGMMAFVLWYVIDRRAKMKASESAKTPATAPARP